MSNKVLIKKSYDVDDNNEFLLVKEFLILEGKESNELVLKLLNVTNENCRDIKFIVTQLDANGVELEQSTFECRYMKNNANSEFVPKKAMTIRTDCVDVIVDLAFASFQTAYYSKGELNPITPNMRHQIDSKDGNRLVKNKHLSRPILIAITLAVALLSFLSYMVTSIEDFRNSTVRFYYDNVEYSFLNRQNGTGTLQVVGMHKNASSLVIPERVGDYEVVSIKESAFRNNSSLVTVDIQGDIIINPSAFQNCYSLTSINMPNVKHIGYGAFSYCHQLQSVTLKNVDMIESYAFSNCSNLLSFVLDNNTKPVALSGYIFDDCARLETVYINQEINKSFYYDYIFNNCYNIKNLKIDELHTNTIKMLFGNNISIKRLLLENVEIGKMNEIVNNQFSGLTSLKSFKVDNLVTGKIGSNAFSGCTKLETVEFGTDVYSIGTSAFANTSLKAFNFTGVHTINSKAFENSSLETVDLTKSSLTRINSSVFSGITELTSVILNNDITSLGLSSFKNCTNLSSIKLSSRITEIGDSAFENCSALYDIELPAILTKLGSRSFVNCKKLTDIYIPGTVISIPSNCFQNAGLINVELGDGVKDIYSYAFNNCTSLEELIIPNSVMNIYDSAFYNTKSLKHVTIPFIGSKIDNPATFYEFFVCESLESIKLTNCNSLKNSTFRNMKDLKEVIIMGELTVIPDNAFEGCESLQSVEFSDSVVQIGSSAFKDCFDLRSFTLNEDIEQISSSAFENCYRLWEVYNYSQFVITAGAENSNAGNIGMYAIKVHTSEDSEPVVYETINDVYYFGYVDGNAHLLEYVPTEEEKDDLESDDEPEPLEKATGPQLVLPSNFLIGSDIINNYKIHARAFYKQDFYSVKVPEGVTSVGNSAFGYCTGLELVYIPSTIEYLYNNVFEGCDKIYEVFNLTDYDLAIGESDLGGVALNAIVIRDTYDAIPLVIDIRGDIEYRLDYNTNIAYAIGFSEDSDLELTFPSYFYNDDHYFNNIQIYKDAFAYSNIEKINFASSVTKIGNGAFQSCPYLNDVTFNGCNLKTIGDSAFYNCYELKTFDLPYNAPLTTIGSRAFYSTELKEFTVPYYCTLIDEYAFYNCHYLTLIYNYSTLSISAGNTNNGYIGNNAFGVYSNKNNATIIDNGNFRFAKKNNIWYLINIDESEFDDYFIDLPEQISNSISSSTKYRVWTTFYTPNYSDMDLFLPTTVAAIDNGIDCDLDNVYYGGYSYQWNAAIYNHSSKFYYASIYYYSTCVHDYSTWTYVNGEISTSQTSLNYSEYISPTCTETGINRGYCPECSYYNDITLDALGHNFVNNVCNRCNAEKKTLTEEMFNSSLFTNASSYSYTYSNGTITSTNKNTYSSSSLTFNANSDMHLEFNINANIITGYGDRVSIYLNGVLQTQYTYNTYDKFEIDLNYGDRLQFTFQRGSYTNNSACLTIDNMTMIYEK